MKYAILVTALSLVLVGCESLARQDEHAATGHAQHRPLLMTSLEDATEAVAVIHPLGDSKVSGIVRFSQTGDKVRVVAEVRGLSPNGTHGFHVHEYGDCSAPDGSSAGSHYNPEGHPHAGPNGGQRHAGDFGNLKADENGVARLELVVDNITIAGQRNPIIGRAVIVHEKADDLKSQPTGDAGGRIACGIIGVAKPENPATQAHTNGH